MDIEELKREMMGTRAEIEEIKSQLAEQGENKKLQLRLKELQYLQLWRVGMVERLGGKLSNVSGR